MSRESRAMRSPASLLLMLLVFAVVHPVRAEPDEAMSLRNKPREVTTVGFESHPPVFAKKASTLNPIDIVRDAWKGYLTNMCEPWGMLPGLKPTYRFWFQNKALPWAELKHHMVDGFDNNGRNAGAHARLHEMLGAEKEDDPVEAGQIAYWVGIADPEGGLAYGPDKLPRHCTLGHGEQSKNLMLLYEQTGERWLRDWAKMMLDTMRRYANVTHLEGVGPVAEYWQGGDGGQLGVDVGAPPVREKPADVSIAGWQHIYVGWNAHGFSTYYEMTGDQAALDFAVALSNRLLNSADAHGDDGSFRPDGSFGSRRGTSGSIHGHSHGHCLPGLLHLGEQLIKANRREDGLRRIVQAQRSFDFLYDRARNPDAGSLTGWVPEWLYGLGGEASEKLPSDCEGCTMGDVTEVSCMLGAASRLDPSLADHVSYYDRAEQIFRGQVVESLFKVTPKYLAIVKNNIEKQVEKDLPNASYAAVQAGVSLAKERADEVERRYRKAQADAERMNGRILGLCGFPDWVNNRPWAADPTLPSIDMMGCCADATIRAAHAVWFETVTGDAQETRVNLALNRASPLVDVVSCLPHRGEVNVMVKTARKVMVRVPHWTQKDQAKVYVDEKPVPAQWDGSYVVFKQVKTGQQLTVTYPLRIARVKEVIKGVDFVEYTEKWRGNTIVDIAPPGKWLPMFNRPELDTAQLR